MYILYEFLLLYGDLGVIRYCLTISFKILSHNVLTRNKVKADTSLFFFFFFFTVFWCETYMYIHVCKCIYINSDEKKTQ